MNVKTEASIRALREYKKTELQKILNEYHDRCREVDNRIEEIRAARGTKLKGWSTEDDELFWQGEGRGRVPGDPYWGGMW